MAMVGYRGSEFEKGLGAAVRALDPELTIGSDSGDAPNSGLLRAGSQFGLFIFTDENDCTHDGSLDEDTSCGDQVCEFADREDLDESESPLIPVRVLREQLLDNLNASRGETVPESDVVVASIHGTPKPFVGEPPSTCTPDESHISQSCVPYAGRTYSGARYERFLRAFPEGQFFPAPTAPGAPLTGWSCHGHPAPATRAVAQYLGYATRGCFTKPTLGCTGPEDDSCPDHPWTGDAGLCAPVPMHDRLPASEQRYYCSSGIQVRLRAPHDVDASARLEQTGWCIPESIAQPDAPRGCVVARQHYELVPCTGGSPGLRLHWSGDPHDALFRLAGLTVIYEYACATREQRAER